MSDTPLDFELQQQGYYFDESGQLAANIDEEDFVDGCYIVTIPGTGHVTVMDVPDLACLLEVGASKTGLVKAMWRHPEASFDECEIEEGEIDFLYQWCVWQFAKTDDGLHLGAIARIFHIPPSKYVGIWEQNRNAAIAFDATIAESLGKEEERQVKAAQKK